MNDKEKKELLGVLKRSRLCRNLEEGEMERLLVKEGTVRSFFRGERVFQETDRPEAVYVLLDGSVIIAKETFSGKRILLTQLEMPGVLFGEVYVFMEKSSYNMYVEAAEKTRVLILDNQIFTEKGDVLSRKLRENLLEVFAEKAYNMNQKLRILGSGTLRERSLSREEMADYLNITRPSLSRELGKMQEEGILELSRRQILVKDQEKLEFYL